MINSRITAERHVITLALEGAPPLTDAFGEATPIAGVQLIYRDHEAPHIEFATSDGSHLVLDISDEAPENWPSWLRELVDQYQPRRP